MISYFNCLPPAAAVAAHRLFIFSLLCWKVWSFPWGKKLTSLYSFFLSSWRAEVQTLSIGSLGRIIQKVTHKCGLSLVSHDLVLCTILSSLFIVLSSPLQSFLVLSCPLQSFLGLSNPLQSILVISSPLQSFLDPPVDLYSPPKPFADLCSFLSPF